MSDWLNKCHFGDCLQVLQRVPDGIVNTCVTSPPYFGLRDYGHAGQIGLEPTPDEFIAKLVGVFREVRRVLSNDGTLWVNMGDSYAGSGRGTARVDSQPDCAVGGGGLPVDCMGDDHLRGSQLSAGLHESPRKSGAIGRAWVPPPAGLKQKDLIGIPWMLAFALRADGWYLRQDIIWAKPNPMPESVTDRCTKSHEYIFLMSKSQSYYCDMAAIKEPAAPGSIARWAQDVEGQIGSDRVPGKTNGNMKAVGGGRSKRDSFQREDSKRAEAIPGQSVGTHRPDRDESEYDIDSRNKRSVWTVATTPYKGAHFATFPIALIEPCILAGAPAGGVVLDPFFGSGTTGQVAQALGRKYIGIELNADYKALQDERLRQPSLDLEAA